MGKIVEVKPNQSLLDVILTEYGSLEAGMEVAAENEVDISNIPLTGSFLQTPVVTPSLIDTRSSGYLRQNGIVIGTLSQPAMDFMVVLKPSMEVVPNVVGNPHIIGNYSFDFKELPDFIHENPLTTIYLSDNELCYEAEERYLAGYAEETSAQLSVTPMTDKSIPYKLAWSVGFGYMMVWSDLTKPVVTATFKDIEGSEAYCAPLTLLDNVSQTVIDRLVGDIDVSLVSATSSSVILRLTRSHVTALIYNFSHVAMEWIGVAATGTPDPLDPTNLDKRIVILGSGTHTLGLRTAYHIEGSMPLSSYPSSAFTMVVKVQ